MKKEVELKNRCIYEFRDLRLVREERVLARDELELNLPPKVFDLLVVFLEDPGHLIEKSELLDKLWPDAFVEEATLSRTTLRTSIAITVLPAT